MPVSSSFRESVIFLLALQCGALGRPSLAEGQSSWAYYQPRSLAATILEERETVLHAFAAEPERRIALGGISFPSLPSIQYMDSTRAISRDRMDLIRRWTTSYGLSPRVLEMSEKEMLFREDSLDLWLPVQNTLVQDFKRELRRGDPVTLFIVWVGARGTSEDIDWVFLVYGYRRE
jgi:hypothetical protein